MYEYKVIEAPVVARRGIFRKPASYAETLSDTINEMALEKWEYQRAETDPQAGGQLLVFRKPVAKAKSHDEMTEPRSFSDRLLETEGKFKSHRSDSHRSRGRDLSGPIRPRRARVVLDDAGTITERPKMIAADNFDLDMSSEDIQVAAEQITPIKPKIAAEA